MEDLGAGTPALPFEIVREGLSKLVFATGRSGVSSIEKIFSHYNFEIIKLSLSADSQLKKRNPHFQPDSWRRQSNVHAPLSIAP
jgi:hypothetical protein